MNKNEKHQYLLAEKQRIEEKLQYLYKGFRGVKHEDAASELKYTQIRVYEDHLRSITAEIKNYEQR